MLDAAADAFVALRARLGPYPHPYFKVVQSAGGYGMESPGLIWIPTGVGSANLRYLAAHETAHQWFYGIVGNDQALEPFTDEAAADFVARSVLGLKRASRCSTGRLDLRIYDYPSTCYYERIYIQGGNLLDEARRRMGSTAFWAALRGYIASHRNAIAPTSSLLYALDAATPLDLGHTLFEPRFPRLY
jgi:aminopeptidase N